MQKFFVRAGIAFLVIAALGAGAYFSRDRWLPLVYGTPAATLPEGEESHAPAAEVTTVKLSVQARQNLKLVSQPVKLQNYWRSIELPGVIVDRPGQSDRGVTAPAVSVVVQIHAYPGDTVKPGDPLFTLRLVSEYLQNAQSELFKGTREIGLIEDQRKRLEGAAKSGAIAESRIIELDNQLKRQTILIQTYRQDLLTRGLTLPQIENVANGKFVSTITVVAPPPATPAPPTADIVPITFETDNSEGRIYEVQELKVDLGRQVQAGELLATLSNHRSLYIEGHAFKRDAANLERAAQNAWPVRVEFAEDDRHEWPTLDQTFGIRHLANSVDVESRTFDFFIPLSNQSRSYTKEGQAFVVWRFRPGQRVRLQIPVEQFQKVIVLPAGAVVRDGPDAFAFRQNGELFDRKAVHLLYEDRNSAVIAADGSLAPGSYIAQGSAATINRALKSQSTSGVPAGMHVHADGSVHGAH